MRRWKLTKFDWNEETKSAIIGREWEIHADRVEVEGHSILKAYRSTPVQVPGVPTGSGHQSEPHMKLVEHLVYISRDWDDVELIEDGQDV